MRRRSNPRHLILVVVVVLGLTPLMVDAAPRAQIAFSSDRDGNKEIYVMDADGKNQRRLTEHPGHDWQPSWSPDGKRIAFTSSEVEDIERKRPRIYVMDADGKNRRRLSNEFVAEWDPSWSPDGKRIAFTSSGVMEAAGGPWRIYVMDADGGNKQRLSNDAGPGGWNPSWSPDGQHIAFVSHGDGNDEIYVMNADGAREVRRTKDGSEDTDPVWFDPAFAIEVAPLAVDSVGKKFTMWGWLKQIDK